MSDDWSPKTEIEGLQDYLFEANLPPQIQSGQNRIAAESLLEYFVIDKRRFELDEIKKGMDAVSLAHYLRQDARIASIVFPRNSEKIIDIKSMKEMVVWDEVPETFVQKKKFFEDYIDELALRNEGNDREHSTDVYIYIGHVSNGNFISKVFSHPIDKTFNTDFVYYQMNCCSSLVSDSLL